MNRTDVAIDFTLFNDMRELDRLNQQLNHFRVQAGLETKCFQEINLALEELFANFVHHAHRQHEGRHAIRFSISLKDRVLTIRTEDSGTAFNPQKAAPPDVKCPLEQRKIGGLGIVLIKRTMDAIHYQRTAGKNITTFVKYIENTSNC